MFGHAPWCHGRAPSNFIAVIHQAVSPWPSMDCGMWLHQRQRSASAADCDATVLARAPAPSTSDHRVCVHLTDHPLPCCIQSRRGLRYQIPKHRSTPHLCPIVIVLAQLLKQHYRRPACWIMPASAWRRAAPLRRCLWRRGAQRCGASGMRPPQPAPAPGPSARRAPQTPRQHTAASRSLATCCCAPARRRRRAPC